MKLSVKSDYAARAVLGLSRSYPTGQAQRVEQIAQDQGIPSNYLVQILIELKTNNIVQSQRGKEGGYRLARHPAEITLGDVLRTIYGRIFDTPALSDPLCPVELRSAWRQLQSQAESTADSLTFQKIMEEGAGQEKMYYI